MGPNTCHKATGEQAHDIDLVRGLAVDDAAASARVQLFGAARAVEKIGVIERRNHSYAAVRAAADQFAGAQNRQVKTVAVAHNQEHTRSLCGIDHAGAVVQCERHGFFNQNMFAVSGSDAGVIGMELVGRGDVDRLHLRFSTKSFYGVEAGCSKVFFKLPPCRVKRVGRRDQVNARVMLKCRQHQGEGAAQPDDAQAHRGRRWVHKSSTSSAVLARETHSMMLLACSSSNNTQSRCSASPAIKPVRQVPQLPLSQELGTLWPWARRACRMD